MFQETISAYSNNSFRGDVTVNNVESNAKIQISDGNLHVLGTVGDNVTIICNGKQITQTQGGNNINLGGIFISAGTTTTSTMVNGKVTVDGNIGTNVTIECDGVLTAKHILGNEANIKTQSNIKVKNIGSNVTMKSHNGNFKFETSGVGCQFETHNGNISFNEIAQGCIIKTHNGDISGTLVNNRCSIKSYNGKISVYSVGEDTRLESHNASIKCQENVGANSVISCHNDNIKVLSAHPTAKLTSKNGKVYINGVKQSKVKPKYSYSNTSSNYGTSPAIQIQNTGRGTTIQLGNNVSMQQAAFTLSNLSGMFGSFGSLTIQGQPANNSTSYVQQPSYPRQSVQQQPTNSYTRQPAQPHTNSSSIARTESTVTTSTQSSVSSILNAYSAGTQRYIDSFKNETSHVEKVETLEKQGIIIDIPDSLCCPISLDVMNIPVRLDGVLYDLNSLVNIKPNAKGERINPLTRDLFLLRDLQPARDVEKQITDIIHKARQDNTNEQQNVSVFSK